MDIDNLNVIEYTYLGLIENSISIEIFESWVYQTEELHAILSNEDYLDLISLNYSSNYIYYEIGKILDNYIDYGKLETIKITVLLKQALRKDEKIGEILRSFYNMYCDGYYFLDDLGLGYGLSCEVPSCANSWEELSNQQRINIINSFYPQLEHDLQRTLNWIESKKILLTGTKNDLNRWQYIDNRTGDEMKSTVWIDAKNSKGLRVMKRWTYTMKRLWNFWRRD